MKLRVKNSPSRLEGMVKPGKFLSLRQRERRQMETPEKGDGRVNQKPGG